MVWKFRHFRISFNFADRAFLRISFFLVAFEVLLISCEVFELHSTKNFFWNVDENFCWKICVLRNFSCETILHFIFAIETWLKIFAYLKNWRSHSELKIVMYSNSFSSQSRQNFLMTYFIINVKYNMILSWNTQRTVIFLIKFVDNKLLKKKMDKLKKNSSELSKRI